MKSLGILETLQTVRHGSYDKLHPPTHRDKAAMNGAQLFFSLRNVLCFDDWATCPSPYYLTHKVGEFKGTGGTLIVVWKRHRDRGHPPAGSAWSNITQNYLKGRLSLALASGVASAFSYDAMGRVAGLGECFPSQCGTAADNKLLSYVYDKAGNLTSSSDGAGATATYASSPGSEVQGITSSLGNSTHPGTLVSGVQNGPNGPISYSLGNGRSRFNSYDALGRIDGDTFTRQRRPTHGLTRPVACHPGQCLQSSSTIARAGFRSGRNLLQEVFASMDRPEASE